MVDYEDMESCPKPSAERGLHFVGRVAELLLIVSIPLLCIHQLTVSQRILLVALGMEHVCRIVLYWTTESESYISAG
jgi:hypothetical protein